MKTIYIGTVNSQNGSIRGKGEGIYTLQEKESNDFAEMDIQKSDNAGILAISKDKRNLYAANESKSFAGLNGSGGGISAYRIEEDESLTFLNDSIAYGSRTAYAAVSDDNQYLIAANHGSHTTVTCSYVKDENGKWQLKRGFDDSSIALFSLKEDGSIGELKDLMVFDHAGYWCHGGGQSTSHIHFVSFHHDLIFACNRGADEIEILKLDRENEKLILLNCFHTRSAYAPRYLAFHPSEKILYVLNENYPSLTVYRYTENGDMEELQLIATMPEAYYDQRPLPQYTKPHADKDERNTSGFGDQGAAMPSDIHIMYPFLYVSNRCRMENANIAVFRIQGDGQLKLSGHIPLAGHDPRGFAVSDGILYAGLLDRNLVQLFSLQKEDGLVCDHLSDIDIPAPSSLIIREG